MKQFPGFLVRVIIFLICLIKSVGASEPPFSVALENSLQIRYIANEGVLLTHGKQKVLIDAHHFQGNPLYDHVPPLRLQQMVNGLKPFDGVSLILATHMHADHFDAATVGQHLLLNSRTRFVASEQMTSLIKKEFKQYEKIRGQIETVTPGVGFFEEGEFNGIRVKLLGMKHSGKRFNTMQNIAYIIKLGKYKLLHIGDADGSIQNFEPFKLPSEGIDIAFIPYWFLTHKALQKIVNEYIQPGRIIAIHIPPAKAAEVAKEVLEYYPGAIVFTKPLQTVEF